MIKISSFPGMRYDPKQVGDLARVISPPYDKISTQQREILWHRHESNAVRLILPPPGKQTTDVATQSTEGESANWYIDAADRFHRWRQSGILKTDTPRLYLYRQTFAYEGKKYTRNGLFGALLLDNRSQAHAHEMTFEGPKADRLRLTRAAQANLSPVFLLVDGTETEWKNVYAKFHEPLFQFRDLEDQEHQLYSLADENILRQVYSFLDERTLVIADGHHRYETAMNYRREMIEKSGKDPDIQPWGRVLVLLVPMESSGLLVLPTHRILSELPSDWLATLRQSVSPYFEMIPFSEFTSEQIRELLSQTRYKNSIFVCSANQGLLLVLKTGVQIPALASVPDPIRELNVSILHHYIFPVCLGLQAESVHAITRYIRGEEEAISPVRSRSAAAAFLVGAISPKTVFEVSLHGVRMPQKSTDFYPKIPTGLVFRSLAENDG